MEHTHLVKGLDFALLQKVGADAAVLPPRRGWGGGQRAVAAAHSCAHQGGQYFFCW